MQVYPITEHVVFAAFADLTSSSSALLTPRQLPHAENHFPVLLSLLPLYGPKLRLVVDSDAANFDTPTIGHVFRCRWVDKGAVEAKRAGTVRVSI